MNGTSTQGTKNAKKIMATNTTPTSSVLQELRFNKTKNKNDKISNYLFQIKLPL